MGRGLGIYACACPQTRVCYRTKIIHPLDDQRGCYVAQGMAMMEEYVVVSSVRGHHVYKDIWTPAIGEVLTCTQELTNVHDVAVKRSADIVGHVPRSISYLCYLFIERGGIIE